MACTRTICVHTTLNKSDSAAACRCARSRGFLRVRAHRGSWICMGLFAEDMRVSFFQQRVCVRSKDAAHLLSPLSLPRSSLLLVPPPRLIDPLPPCARPLLPPRLPLSIPEIASRSHSRRIFFFSSPSAPPVSSPPPSPPSTSFARVYITRACAPSLSFLFSLFPAPSPSFAFPSRFARNARFSSQGIYQLEDNHRGDEDCVIKRMEEGLSVTICIFLWSFS